ncbi:uncharacterized protein LOC131991429 [Centropristis striata]|uniref:uncharacterized protein LOC131991429 n=1 Tax=Centropristis striata TaxID=184440 RepID=UPI0027E0BC70|nr:uncharacterized protein LOC131991429 [Centropristis striata]
MGYLVELGWFILLVAVVNIEAQKQPLNIQSRCLGNVLRVDISRLGGFILEVSAVKNHSAVLLTPTLASQCGFRMQIDQLGNAKIYASIQNCFAQNVGDQAFTTTLNLHLRGNGMFEDELYQVAETCHYSAWASREILCERDYMQVSVQRAAPGDPRRDAKKQPIDSGFRITAIVFFTPEERLMKTREAISRGYGVANTPTRLVLRSPKTSPETFTQDVAGIPMTVLRTSTQFQKNWMETHVEAQAACPILQGSVSFTPRSISWFLPRHLGALISSGPVQLLEVHMGVDGERLDGAKMAARQYSLSVNDVHIILEIPVGAVGGHFKSHVQGGQYFTTYSIEPMLELLWTEGTSHQDTKYKVLLPFTSPLIPHTPQVIDNSVPGERVFKVAVGPFSSDVALMNITVPSGVLSLADLAAKGLNLLEHPSPNSSSKVFTLDVPFRDQLVLQMKGTAVTVYNLQLTFGLLVLPEFAPFSHSVNLQAQVTDIVNPSVSGGCDHQNFQVLVTYGSHGFDTVVGGQLLTAELAQQFGFINNGTHGAFTVPLSSPNAVVEAVESSSIRSRLHVALRNPQTNKNIKEFSMACNFLSSMIECFPNGTMTALATKVESVPSLNMSQLTLRDPACGPAYSNGRYAYFVFTVNSCGTTRNFRHNMMMYENEISLPDELSGKRDSKTEEVEYDLKVFCYYDINTNSAMAFHPRARRSEPNAEDSRELQAEIRLAAGLKRAVSDGDSVLPVSSGPILIKKS